MTAIPPHAARRHDDAVEAAFQAVLTADAVLTGAFPGTLSPAIAPLAWTGYRPADGPRSYEACAITHLGSHDGVRGWWLHHTQEHDEFSEAHHVLTLIAPCTCGTYLHREIPDEDTLGALLDELDTAPGAPVACDYRLRIRAGSHDDQRHTSFAPYAVRCPRDGRFAEEFEQPIPYTDDSVDCARCPQCGHAWAFDSAADASCLQCGGSGKPGAFDLLHSLAPRCPCGNNAAGSDDPEGEADLYAQYREAVSP